MAVATKKAPKKPPARRARTVRTVTVTVPADEDDDQVEDAAKGIPLFEGLGEEVQIQVYRVEPIEEGSIGHLSSDSDEATIRRRWGGGVYRLSAKGTDGKFGKMQRTVTIGGDPKFESEDAIRKHAIKMGKIPSEAPKPAPAAPVAPGFGDVAGLMAAMIQASQAQATALMQAQIKASDDARARDQQFFQTILTLKADKHAPAAPAADPGAMVPLMLKFLQLGRDMGSGGGETDPVTAFISALPQILPQAQAMLAAGAANQQGAPPALPPVQPAAPPAAGAPRKITLSGPIAEQLMKTASELQKRGFDPEKSLELALKELADGLVQLPAGKPEAPPAALPEKAATPAAAAGGGNGTSPPARATRKK